MQRKRKLDDLRGKLQQATTKKAELEKQLVAAQVGREDSVSDGQQRGHGIAVHVALPVSAPRDSAGAGDKEGGKRAGPL